MPSEQSLDYVMNWMLMEGAVGVGLAIAACVLAAWLPRLARLRRRVALTPQPPKEDRVNNVPRNYT